MNAAKVVLWQNGPVENMDLSCWGTTFIQGKILLALTRIPSQ